MFKPLKIPCLQTLDELKAECKRLGLRMILPDHLKPEKHKRDREEEAPDLSKAKRFKIELEKLNDPQADDVVKDDFQENDQSRDGLTEIAANSMNCPHGLPSNHHLYNQHRNKLQTSKLTNGITVENGELLDRNGGVWHNNGRLKNVELDYSKLCESVQKEENLKQSDQILIIERIELEKQKIQKREIIEIDLMSEEDQEKPPESLTTTTSPEQPSTNVKRESPFYVKDDPKEIQRVVRNLKNYADLEKAFNFLVELKKYADEMNSKLVPFNMAIVVENDVDQELPPKFTYTNGYDLSMLDDTVLKKIKDAVQKCSCVHDCAFFLSKNVATCCYASYADGCFYTVCGKVKNQSQVSKRGPIVECTEYCTCTKKCPNRVIQKGTQVPLAIFKTQNGRGWGLKAREKIPKNTFICTYRGQVISSEEAVRRQKMFPFKDRYFFNLDYNEHLEFEYVVDATNVSNIGRFLNHSCTPNCETFVAYVESAFLKLPVIAFFTNRQINKEEELTIDYFLDADYIPSGDKSGSKIDCLCGSINCKRHPFFTS